MKKFEILEHKADLKIKVFGKTKEELFQNALLGMEESMKVEITDKGGAAERVLRVKSSDFQALLVDFLNEVLYLNQMNKEIYKNAEFKKLSDTELEIQLNGQKIEKFGEDIKAATYHNLDIHQKKDGSWEATILFDI